MSAGRRKGTGYFSFGDPRCSSGCLNTTDGVVSKMDKEKSSLSPFFVLFFLSLAACGEPMFENAGSQNSLLEDREACVMEIDQSPAALAYRRNPTEHPDYPGQIFDEMNQCIERKGWKQVRSQQEQEQLRDAITAELAQTGQPAPHLDDKATETFTRAVEDRLARSSSVAR